MPPDAPKEAEALPQPAFLDVREYIGSLLPHHLLTRPSGKMPGAKARTSSPRNRSIWKSLLRGCK
jgi:hypothetical protein